MGRRKGAPKVARIDDHEHRVLAARHGLKSHKTIANIKAGRIFRHVN